MALCRATRTDGNPCRARSQSGSEHCFWHDDNKREDLLKATRKGGSRRAIELPEVDVLTPEKARMILAGVVEAVAKGSMDAATGRTLGYLLSIESRIREGHELEKRIDALERVEEERKACRVSER